MSDDVSALQDALAGVHATIWAYGEIGATVSDQHLAAVAAADNAYRGLRGQLEDVVRGLGDQPVASQPGYTLPMPVADDLSALHAAAALEDAMCAHWRYCSGRVDAVPIRTFCIDALTSAAGAAVRWRQTAGVPLSVPAFPGLA